MLAVLPATAHAAFTVSSTPLVDPGPLALVVGDFNGDGVQDIATANFSASNSVSVLIGHGNGTFGAADNITIGPDPFALAVGDLNGDGNQDLVVARFNTPGTLALLKGNGNGTFASPLTLSVGDTPAGVAVGDFNGDGNQDIVASARNPSGTVSLLKGNGNGTFAPLANLTVGAFPTAVAVGDFNSDGNDDVAAATGGTAGTVSILLGAGNATFAAAPTLTAGNGPSSLAVGDFNGDGNQDIATSNGSNNGSLSIFVGKGDGTFATAGTPAAGNYPEWVAAGDLNGDGNQDLAVASNNIPGTIPLFNGSGDGVFTLGDSLPVGDQPSSVAVGDFNGDGNQDLASADNKALPATVTVLVSTAPPAAGNLLADGGAESPGATGTLVAFPLPTGWTREEGKATAVRYGVSGLPSLLTAPPIRGGNAFLAGGPGSGDGALSQTVDVSASAASIDAGLAGMHLSGLLGGYRTQNDRAQVTATFLDAAGAAIGTPLQIGPVTAADRKNITTLLARSATAKLPAGTRRVRVRFQATADTSATGTYDDGYADNLTLTLDAPAPPPVVPAAAPKLTGLKLSPASFRAAKRGGAVSAARKRKAVAVGTRITYTLDRAATTTFTVTRKRPGVRKGTRCVAAPRKRVVAKKPKRCTRTQTLGAFAKASAAGAGSLRFTGRIKSRALAPGKYVITAVAKASDLKVGRGVAKAFTIVR